MEDDESRARNGSAESNDRKRVRDDAIESDLDSLVEVKRLRDDLLGVFDDSDPNLASQELHSVMKSFEDELTTQEGLRETQPDLGYLLEASDDELGLPPAPTPPPPPPPPPSAAAPAAGQEETVNELMRASSDSSGIDEFWGFEQDQMPSYDSFELGVGDNYGCGFVAVDGLFEFSDDLSFWRQES